MRTPPPVPFRFEHPHEAGARWLVRPRLLARLARRFLDPVTVVTAGAGFGKSVLLAQAIEQNRLDPQGADVWLRATAADADAAHLAAGLAQAVGLAEGVEPTAATIAAALWTRAPTEIALIVDDVHRIPPDGPGARFLQDLIDRLPGNGHLVLAGRSVPFGPVDPPGLAEADLAFTPEELVAFAADRGVEHDVVDGSGGWPAVVELRAGAGRVGAEDFLWEEVVDQLDPDRREGVRRLLAFGGFDDALVAVVTGRSWSAAALAAGLPLATVDVATGTVWLHELWPRSARGVVVDERIRAGADLLWSRREQRRAIEVMVALGDEVGQLALLERLAATDLPDLHVDEVDALLAAAPAGFRDGPQGDLLRSQALLGVDGEGARAALQRAAASFAAAGDDEGEARALTRLAWTSSWDTDLEAMTAALARLAVLAEGGNRRAARSVALSGAYLAQVAGRPEDARRQVLDGGTLDDPVTAPLASFILATAELDAGRPDAARAAATRERARARGRLQVGLVGVAFEAAILDRLPDEADARVGMDELLALCDRFGVAENHASVRAGLAAVAAAYGRSDEARALLEEARVTAAGVGSRAQAPLAAAEIAVLLAEGDEAGAAAVVADLLVDPGLGGPLDRGYLRMLAALYLLAPEARAPIDAMVLGPVWDRMRALARALAAARDGDLGPVLVIDWDLPALRAHLPLAFVIELAVAGVAAGADGAAEALTGLAVDVRPRLRWLAEAGAPVLAPVARELLTSLPTPPDGRIEIRVLGPVELWRDGAPVTDEAWARARVRGLLQLLVDRRRIPRAQAMAAMWPDLEPAAAADNLRVNLNHLLRLLQPDRRPDEPSWYVTVEDDVLVLRPSPQLDVDVDAFVTDLAAARSAEAALDLDGAIAHYRSALDRYRGDYLVDAADDRWGEFDRTRHRSDAVEAALRAGELLLAGGDATGAARLGVWAAGLDPFVDAAHRLAARALLADGDRAGAWRLLSSVVAAFGAEGLRPDDATLTLLRSLEGGPAAK